MRPWSIVTLIFFSVRLSADRIGVEDVLSISQRKQRPQSLGSEFLLRSAASSSGPDASLTPSPDDQPETVSNNDTVPFSKIPRMLFLWDVVLLTRVIRNLMTSVSSL